MCHGAFLKVYGASFVWFLEGKDRGPCGYFHAEMRGSRRTAKSDRSRAALPTHQNSHAALHLASFNRALCAPATACDLRAARTAPRRKKKEQGTRRKGKEEKNGTRFPICPQGAFLPSLAIARYAPCECSGAFPTRVHICHITKTDDVERASKVASQISKRFISKL